MEVGASAGTSAGERIDSGKFEAVERHEIFSATETFLGLGFRRAGRFSNRFQTWHWHSYLQDREPKRWAWAGRSVSPPPPPAPSMSRPGTRSAGTWPRLVLRAPRPSLPRPGSASPRCL